MKIIYDEIAFLEEASVAALGMFDGVHIGHQELIRNAVTLAKSMNARSVVCTFDRHPLSVIRPDRAPKPLLTLQQNLLKLMLSSWLPLLRRRNRLKLQRFQKAANPVAIF